MCVILIFSGSLQWGLGLSTEESGRAGSKHPSVEAASMGARSFNRGKDEVHLMLGYPKKGLQWGLGLSTEERFFVAC